MRIDYELGIKISLSTLCLVFDHLAKFVLRDRVFRMLFGKYE